MTKAASDSLLENELFREIADSAPVCLWRIDASFQQDWVNKHWLDYTGGLLEEEVAFAWVQKVHPDDRDKVVEEFDRAFEAREPAAVEFRLRGQDGSYRWFLDSGAPHFRDGQFAGYVGSCVDITERKEAEAQRNSLEADRGPEALTQPLGMLGTSVAHELNQPLNSIIASAKMLEDLVRQGEGSVADLGEVIASIRRSAERASWTARNCEALIIRELIQREREDLADVLRSIEPLVRAHPAAANISIAWDLSDGLHVSVARAQIQNLLLNVAVSVVEAMQGRPESELVISAAQWGSAAIASIAGAGPGVPEHWREPIFVPSEGTKGDEAATGLWLSRLIVASHGGRIWVEENPGEGFAVRFAIPLDLPNQG